jgi:hypothetical protein
MNTHKFKFSMGQIVYTVKQSTGLMSIECKLCEGKQFLQVKDRSIKCPDCFGRGTSEVKIPIEYVADKNPLTIGQMRVCITDSKGLAGESLFDNYKPQKSLREEYMCIESGIGSGAIYWSEKLSATLAEAEAMAEKMNSEEYNG